jgi:hypothetical protein
MRIVEKYSHLNGLEFLLVHKPSLWKEIQDVIGRADEPMPHESLKGGSDKG